MDPGVGLLINEQIKAVFRNMNSAHASLNELRKKGVFCDVTIIVGERKFPCHRNILSANSDYFRAMFVHNFRESITGVVVMHVDLVNADAFAEILNFFYTSELNIHDNNLCHLIEMSEYLCLNHIEELCVARIENRLPEQQIVPLMVFATRTKRYDLLEKLYHYVMQNFDSLSKSTTLLSLSFDHLDDLLVHRSLRAHADVKMDFLSKWMVRQSPKLTDYRLSMLVKHADCHKISTRFMTELIVKYFAQPVDLSNNVPLNVYVLRKQPTLKLIASLNVPEIVDNVNWSRLYGAMYEITNPTKKIVLRQLWDFMFYTNSAFPVVNCVASDAESLLYTYYYDNQKTSLMMTSFAQEPHVSVKLQEPGFKQPEAVMAVNEDSIIICRCYDVRSERFSIYNRYQNTWSSSDDIGSRPNYSRVYQPSMVFFDKSLYVIGGYDVWNENLVGGRFVQQYDFRTSRWNQLPGCRYQHIDGAACVYNGKIYVSGGDDLMTLDCGKEVEEFDVVAQKWITLPRMPRSKVYHFLVPYEGYLFAVGGKESRRMSTDDYTVCMYDVRAEYWTEFSPSAYEKRLLRSIIGTIVC